MSVKSVKISRWEKAQHYEKGFWEKKARTAPAEGADRFRWYEKRAKQVLDRASEYLEKFDRVIALEIGPGPVGLINYIEADERYALDPLEDFNRTIPEILKARNPHIEYRRGTGEDVSSLNRTFNFVILDNVLDHCHNPVKVLTEIHNNLAPSGILFFSVNIYKTFGVIMRNAMEVFEIDKGHPFNFSEKSIRSMLAHAGFEILLPRISNYEYLKNHYKKSGNYKNKIKGYLGLTDIRFSSICRKRSET